MSGAICYLWRGKPRSRHRVIRFVTIGASENKSKQRQRLAGWLPGGWLAGWLAGGCGTIVAKTTSKGSHLIVVFFQKGYQNHLEMGSKNDRKSNQKCLGNAFGAEGPIWRGRAASVRSSPDPRWRFAGSILEPFWSQVCKNCHRKFIPKSIAKKHGK